MSAETYTEPLNKYRCIEDTEFQDWLAYVGVIGRRKNIPQGFPLKPSRVNPRGTISGDLYRILSSNPGYLMPTDTLAEELGLEPNKMGLETVSDGLSYLSVKLIDPTCLFKKVGLGVTKFGTTTESVTTLYELWHHREFYLPIEDLARSVYGTISESTLRGIYRHVYNFKGSTFNKGSHSIEHKGVLNNKRLFESGLEFKLGRRKELVVPDLRNLNQDERLQYFDPLFQDWLYSVGILTKTEERLQNLEDYLKPGVSLTQPQRAIFQTLFTNYGYMVSPQYLERVVIGQGGDHYWINFICRIKEGMKDPNDLVNIYKFGYSLGIKDLSIRPALIKLLFILWENEGNEVTFDQIIERDGIDFAKHPRNIRDGIFALRDVLNGTGYSLEYKKTLRAPNARAVLIKEKTTTHSKVG